jgi:hypothetical protein
VTAISDICRNQGVNANEVLFLGLWTYLERYEYFVNNAPSGGLWPDDEGWGTIDPYMIDLRRTKSLRALFRQLKNRAPRAFYHQLWSEEGQGVSFLLDWVMLDAFLISRGYEARYAFGAPLCISDSDTSQKLAGMLDPKRVYGGLNPRYDRSFMGLTSELQRGPELHPLTAGHQAFALALADWLADDASLALSSLERRGSSTWPSANPDDHAG